MDVLCPCDSEMYPHGSRGPTNADKLREKAGHVPNLTAKDITWLHHDKPTFSP